MSDYAQITDFSAKDALTTGDPEKIILGADFDGEFSAISTAIATKYDSNDIATEAQAEAGTLDTVLITPLQLFNVMQDNGGMVYDIQQLADPNADQLLGWDDSAGAVVGFTAGTGMAFNGTTFEISHLGVEDLTDPNDDRIAFWDDSAGAFAWLDIGSGLEISGTTLQTPSSTGGAGLTYTSGVLAVGAGNGITVNANDVAITDQAATASVPVSLSSGTLGFDLSGITEITVDNLSQSADGVLISDAGTLKVMPLDESGVLVVNAADAIQTFALGDANTLQVLDSTTNRTWTIPANAAVAFKIGTVILLQSINTATITITADTGVVLTSKFNTSSTAATSDTVKAGGRAALVKVATDEWTISGDITD